VPSFKLKSSWVTILQGVEFSIFPLILASALQQCSATALPVIKSQRRESIGILPLKVNKDQIFSDNDKANCLNNYFSSVFTNERLDNIPILESSYPDMPMFTVTVPGVFKLLSKLNPK